MNSRNFLLWAKVIILTIWSVKRRILLLKSNFKKFDFKVIYSIIFWFVLETISKLSKLEIKTTMAFSKKFFELYKACYNIFSQIPSQNYSKSTKNIDAEILIINSYFLIGAACAIAGAWLTVASGTWLSRFLKAIR